MNYNLAQMASNSFKDLEKIQIKDFEKRSDDVKKKIDSETSTFKFFGNIIDLYFSKVMNVFAALAGGEDSTLEKKPEK